MLYLSGCSNESVLGIAHEYRIGLMAQPATYREHVIRRWPYWAADNGCFSQGERFDGISYLNWLSRLRPLQSNCLFAVAPDVIGDAAATWKRSAPYLPIIRALGYKAALVAQNGIEGSTVDWDAFDVLFIGGDNAFKLTCFEIAQEAKARGKHVHMGRVNTWRRFKACAVAGMDSADGTFLGFGPDKNLPKLRRWVDTINLQSRFVA